MAGKGGSKSAMDNPADRAIVAKMLGEGASRDEVAELYNVHNRTVGQWTRREDLGAEIAAVRLTQANRILRITNAAVLARLETPEARGKLSLKELLEIIKTFQTPATTNGREALEAAEVGVWSMLDAGEELPELTEGEIVDADET